MNILITGGSGFLGNALTDELLKNPNNHLFWVSRKAFTPNKKVTILTYDELNDDLKIDIVINLAGAGIADKRWSNVRKQELLDSRLIPTQKLLDFIKSTHYKPKLLINGSAIGYYGVQSFNDNRQLDETSPPICNDFSNELCTKWEILANTATIKTAIIRTGVVLDKTGKGILKRLLPQFQFGLGGKLGNGLQTMSWISIDDWVRAVLFIINKNLSDDLAYRQIYNLTAPNSVNNQAFTQALGKFLNRPTLFFVPAFILKAILGEMATLLLDGQRVYPKVLLEMGFEFEYNNIDEYLTTS
ncbi:TIGR01777 family oxidoreductase [Moraxella oblonga]|uniref:TIGR01777 family oxidoreductase n=1 Tax=Moraxella oblonga TaxID=200413 RepID=UPI00082C34B9|nr:TIGR01777 family oxidoreductase [Moraxella oblonga]